MDHLFNLTVEVQRAASRVPDGYGAGEPQWQPVGRVRGLLRPATMREAYSAQRLELGITHIFYCRPADIEREDRLVLPDGRQLRVVAVRDPNGLGHHLEVECELLEG